MATQLRMPAVSAAFVLPSSQVPSSTAARRQIKSAAEEPAAAAARAARTNVAHRLVVEEQRDERRQLSNLLGGQQRASPPDRRSPSGRATCSPPCARGRTPRRGRTCPAAPRDTSRPASRSSRSPCRTSCSRIAMLSATSSLSPSESCLAQHLLERIRIAADVLLLDLLLAHLVALAAAARAQAQEEILTLALRADVDAHVERELHRREVERARLTVRAEARVDVVDVALRRRVEAAHEEQVRIGERRRAPAVQVVRAVHQRVDARERIRDAERDRRAIRESSAPARRATTRRLRLVVPRAFAAVLAGDRAELLVETIAHRRSARSSSRFCIAGGERRVGRSSPDRR